MKLADVIESIHVKSLSGSLDKEVESICFDSRKVSEGSAFFALKGVEVDGHDFIPKAVESGAVAIVASIPYPADCDVTWLQVSDTREAMALAARNFYGNPSIEMPVVGITGTNGKTTTAFLIHHLLQCSLRRVGLLGTIHYLIGDETHDAPNTTPESLELHRLLREMRDADCRAAVMEVSSHGLAQHRVTGVSFDVGVFTNLTQDHLDYHGTMDEYFEAKKLLFDRMSDDSEKQGAMIVNGDDRWGRDLLKAGIKDIRAISFGVSANCDLKASEIRSDFNGTQFKLEFKNRQYLVRVPLIGRFNVYNVLAALGAAHAIDLNMREAIKNMEDCPQVPGRLELVGERRTNYRVFVDYAHTPDALENVITTLRDLKPNRLITVFGCGGDRDARKRPIMAKAAGSLSDFAILTSDNPRTEDPQKILRDVQTGLSSSDSLVIEDRKEAIRKAIDMAGDKDIVLIAGKGHETYQEIDGVRHHFDDRRVARHFINVKAETNIGMQKRR